MNQHLHSPTQLTEFAREFEEEPDTLFGKIVNRLTNVYNTSYNSVNDVQPGKALTLSGSGVNVSQVTSDVPRLTPNASNNTIIGSIEHTLSSEAVGESSRSSVSTNENVSNDEASSSGADKVILVNR